MPAAQEFIGHKWEGHEKRACHRIHLQPHAHPYATTQLVQEGGDRASQDQYRPGGYAGPHISRLRQLPRADGCRPHHFQVRHSPGRAHLDGRWRLHGEGGFQSSVKCSQIHPGRADRGSQAAESSRKDGNGCHKLRRGYSQRQAGHHLQPLRRPEPL